MPDAFKQKIERKAFMWFGKKLDEDLEFDDAAWARIEHYLDYTFGTGFDDRLREAGYESAEEWWENGGKEYSRKAAHEFAKQINKIDDDSPNSVDIDVAYAQARLKLKKVVAAAMRRNRDNPLETFSPILCDPI